MIAIAITPFVKKTSIMIGATDIPSARKVHTKPVPTLGGLAIFISFLIGILLLQPTSEYNFAILVGAFIILLLGVFDDLYNLSARAKFFVQLIVALLIVF